MIPKKAREFYKPTAQQLKLEEDLVKDLIEFYYKKLRLNLSKLTCHNIYVPKLGTFMAKTWRIDDAILELEKKYTSLAPTSIKKFESRKEYEYLLGNAKMIKQMMEAEDNKKKEIKRKRKEDEADKEPNTDLEE